MLNPQDIREKTFEKALIGGYDMGPVDDYLETLATDYTQLFKENAVLKSKMKVLVEKIEEYRSTEDAMRMALLSAQKMGAQITDDAKKQAEAVVGEATTAAEAAIRKARAELDQEEARLAEAKSRTAKYVESVRMLCKRQLEFFDNIGEYRVGGEPIVTPAPAGRSQLKAAEPEEKADRIDDAVRSIEDSVARIVGDEPSRADDDAPEPPSAQAAAQDEPTRLFSLGDVLGESAEKSENFDLEFESI